MDKKFIPKYECLLCGGTVLMGGGIWEGVPVNAWELVVCDTCKAANHDGIMPGTYPQLEAHLKAKGITPSRNERGFYNWPT